MPEISRFLGIVIAMFYSDHAPPHFHARYGEYEVTVRIDDGAVDGHFPRRALGFLPLTAPFFWARAAADAASSEASREVTRHARHEAKQDSTGSGGRGAHRLCACRDGPSSHRRRQLELQELLGRCRFRAVRRFSRDLADLPRHRSSRLADRAVLGRRKASAEMSHAARSAAAAPRRDAGADRHG